MSRMQRRKGAVAEREVAKLLFPVFPHCSRRSSGEECQESQGVDLKNTGRFDIQVTHSIRPNVMGKFLEVPSRGGRVPLLIFKKNHGEWMVAQRLEDWIEIIMGLDRQREKRNVTK